MRFEAVLFDCDGVLVDSEPITLRVLRDLFNSMGWPVTLAECEHIFLGRAVKDNAHVILEKTGQVVDQPWLERFWDLRDAALSAQLQAVPHIHAAVEAVALATQARVACASGADRRKVELQLKKVGLFEAFEGRIFSGHEMARSKPAPDVYLAAAAALGVEPRRCAVIEDTVTGITAGVAAGATVFAYAPAGNEAALLAAGASACFPSMQNLVDLLA